MMNWTAACQILGLPADHPADAVRPAFNRAIRKTHPDSTGTSKTAMQFTRVIEANKYLTVNRRKANSKSSSESTEQSSNSQGKEHYTSFEAWLDKACKPVYFSENATKFRHVFIRQQSSLTATIIFTLTNANSSKQETTYFYTFLTKLKPTYYDHLIDQLGEPVWIVV